MITVLHGIYILVLDIEIYTDFTYFILFFLLLYILFSRHENIILYIEIWRHKMKLNCFYDFNKQFWLW